MGQIAEDMQAGTCCEICGCYFTKNGKLYTHEYPVTCKDCYKELTDEEKEHHQKALVKTF